MSLNDPLANALSVIINADRMGKTEIVIKPVSTIIKKILTLMNEGGYIGAFEEKQCSGGSYITVALLGRLNNCGAIKPRYPVALKDYEKFEKRYLPAKDFGFIVVSTSKGMMPHTAAKEAKLGGRLLAYCY